ncbi:MAG: bifunctional UDP-N-acetylglucosamine diphosphorylase/glucosamine-1-phosphate N-acetyltransferase GlmU [candidate division FCPU426 bacterium]
MSDLAAVILAAGEGTRLKSATPKVLHRLGGRPMLEWVLRAARAAGAGRQVVVLGHAAEKVRAILPAGVSTVLQAKQLGTGHALRTARPALAGFNGSVLVLCGDAPLITAATLRRLVRTHRRLRASATVLTACLADPFGYGRVLRNAGQGPWVRRIAEEKDATPDERRLTEVNSGAYCFQASWLWRALQRLDNRNRKGEFYLTDVLEVLNRAGRRVAAFRTGEAAEILGVNTRCDLASAAAVMNERKLAAVQAAGVTVWDPASTWIDPDVRIGRDTELLPGTRLSGRTALGTGNRIGPAADVCDTVTATNVSIRHSVVEGSRLGKGVRVGPYAHLRPGTRVADKVTIGNFAEINRSRIGTGVKVGHVSYLGDATVGPDANIGAGTITANYDGRRKHPTRVGARAFIGSQSVLIAPCTVGAGALTGAGAVVKAGTRIPAGTVAVGVPARIIKRRIVPSDQSVRRKP